MIDGMITLIGLVLICLRDSFRSREMLKVENILLRHQLNVLRRKHVERVRLRRVDQTLIVWLYRLLPAIPNAILIVKPQTVIGWHRAGYRGWWRWRSRGPVGRPKIDRELRDLIRQICRDNPLWGAPRIHGELLLLGFSVAKATVSNDMPRRGRDHRRAGSPFYAITPTASSPSIC